MSNSAAAVSEWVKSLAHDKSLQIQVSPDNWLHWYWLWNLQLENVAINDLLPLKAARRNAIANWKWFWGSRVSMVSFTFTTQRHLIGLASVAFTSFHLAKFGWVLFADIHVQCLTRKQNAEFMEGG